MQVHKAVPRLCFKSHLRMGGLQGNQSQVPQLSGVQGTAGPLPVARLSRSIRPCEAGRVSNRGLRGRVGTRQPCPTTHPHLAVA